MSQTASAATQKQQRPEQEENKDEHFFLKYVQNKMRSCNKKLKQIEQLSQQETINADQQKKIDAKQEILDQLSNYKQMLATYQNAEKEYGIKRKQSSKSQKIEKFRQEEKIVVDAISFMMDLQYLSAYFSKGQQLSQELQQFQDKINQIKQLHERCFKLSGGKKQKLFEKLEQAKNTMVAVMYQEKEWKGITQNVKMLIKKDSIWNSSVGGKEKKPSRKVSSAVQRKMSNKQIEVKYEEKKNEQEKKVQKEEKKIEETKNQEAQKQQQQEPQQPQQQEEKQTEKKYVLTKVEPQEKLITRSRSNTNKEKQQPKESKKPARKVTFDESNMNQEKKDEFIEVKTRAQKKQENNNNKYGERRFDKKRGQQQQQQQQQKYPKKKREDAPQQKSFPKKTQQIIQYVKKENPEEKKQE